MIASLVAPAAFLVGAGAGGFAVTRFAGHRGRLLVSATSVEVVLLLVAAITLAAAPEPYSGATCNAVVTASALALGLQNAAVLRLAVPDFTTTVLTMTLTGIAADLRRRSARVAVRRLSSVIAMLIGAVTGAELVLHRGYVHRLRHGRPGRRQAGVLGPRRRCVAPAQS